MSNLEISQKEICDKYGYEFQPSPLSMKVGISHEVKEGIQPIHALRHPSQGDTTGWYIWSGEYSENDDFFQALHVMHLVEWCPFLLPYLGLPAGSRVLIAEDGNYVDVWRDEALLNV